METMEEYRNNGILALTGQVRTVKGKQEIYLEWLNTVYSILLTQIPKYLANLDG